MKKIGMLLATLVLTSLASAKSGDNFNVYINPLGLAVGSLNAGVDYVVAPQWTVGGYGSYINVKLPKSGSMTEDLTINGYGLGVKGTWYHSGALTDSWYVSPFVQYQSIKAETANTAGKLSAEGDGTYLGATTGYGWYWENFNMAVGGGFMTPLAQGKVTVKDSTGGSPEEVNVYSSLKLEFNIGWTF